MTESYKKYIPSFENIFGVKIKFYRNDYKITEITNDNKFITFIKYATELKGGSISNKMEEHELDFNTENDYLNYVLAQNKSACENGMLYIFLNESDFNLAVNITRKIKLNKLLNA